VSKADKTSKEATEKPKKRIMKFNKSYVLILLLVALLVGGGYLGYRKYDSVQKENQRLRDPQESARLEINRVKGEVAKLIDVPQDEDPTVASVTDAAQLTNQQFYAKAQNGDKVLLYGKARKAILYRPSENKIIEVATLNLGNDAQTKTQPDQTSKPAAKPN
jgi:predicted negative regulator of RcsB-dependent stress response